MQTTSAGGNRCTVSSTHPACRREEVLASNLIANSQCAQRVQQGMVEPTVFGDSVRQLLGFVIAYSRPLPHAPRAVVLHILQLWSACVASHTD